MRLTPQLRRRGGAAAGIYLSTALGMAGSLVVFRVLGPADAGRFLLVWGAVDFLGLVFKLASDEALVKYGFRYAAQEDWGRFHRLVRVTFTFELLASLVAAAAVAALAPFTGAIFAGGEGLTVPMLIGSLLLPLAAIEAMAATALILRGRYDVRGFFLTYSMALRLIGLLIGTQFGVTEAVIGLLVAQAVTTLSIAGVGYAALRRFPAAAPEPLGADGRPVLSFVVQSSVDTALISLRVWLAPLILGITRGPTDVALFRAAQAPLNVFAVLSAPARMILLTEQTRDWEHGRTDVVFAGLRRYVVRATLLMIVVVPPLELAMPWLVRLVFGEDYEGATAAARLILLAAAIQLVFGWTKSFPVTIGRPGLRIVAHAIETAVLLSLILVFGTVWGVTGAAAAVLVAAAAHAAVWALLALRLRQTHDRPADTGSGAALGHQG
jgi:O-antigen/teichoic acid export membrane protein